MQKLLPPILLIITGAIMVPLAWTLPLSGPFPTSVRIMGEIITVIGLLIAFLGARLFKTVGTNIMTFGKPDKLVTTGLFAWSRNPMYLGFAFCAVGTAVALGAASSLLIAAVFCIILDRWYVRYEEAIMQRTFGADFEAYCQRVRRWL